MGVALKAPPAATDGEHPSRQRAHVALVDLARPDVTTHVERYLPLALAASGVVAVLPVALAGAIVRSHQLLSTILAGALAMIFSIAFASAGAAVWKRWPGSRDIVFADLMLWNWARRYWTERRLGRARTLYESAKRAGPSVSIDLLERLSRLLQARDAYTQGHSQRVACHAERIAHAMRLPAAHSAKVRTAAAVHDVGKLYTPREILNNPGSLSEAEFRILQYHPVDGAEMLADVGDPEIAAMVRHHHERIDGRGYPDGLAGEEIPLGARIIAVADTFDAITSNRAYSSARTHKKALDVLAKETGAQLDGAVVAAFVHSYTARRPGAWLAFASAFSQRALTWLQASSASLGLSAGTIAPLLPALGVAGALAVPHGSQHARLALQRERPRANASTSAGPLPSTGPASLTHGLKRTATVKRTSPRRGPQKNGAVPPTGASVAVPVAAATSAPASTSTTHVSIPVAAPPGSSEGRGTQTPSGGNTPISPVPIAPTPAPPVPSPPTTSPLPGAPPIEGITPVNRLPTLPSLPAGSSTPSVNVASKEAPIATPVGNVAVTTPTVKAPSIQPP
jgi:putative nucleotidyltransferase with HDIG domain